MSASRCALRVSLSVLWMTMLEYVFAFEGTRTGRGARHGRWPAAARETVCLFMEGEGRCARPFRSRRIQWPVLATPTVYRKGACGPSVVRLCGAEKRSATGESAHYDASALTGQFAPANNHAQRPIAHPAGSEFRDGCCPPAPRYRASAASMPFHAVKLQFKALAVGTPSRLPLRVSALHRRAAPGPRAPLLDRAGATTRRWIRRDVKVRALRSRSAPCRPP